MNDDKELEENLENNIIILNDEDGTENKFEFLDVIEYDNEQYVVLLPVEEDEESEEAGEVVILKIEDSEDEESEEETYVSVEDENVLNTVFEIFKERYKDEFDFED